MSDNTAMSYAKTVNRSRCHFGCELRLPQGTTY